MNKNNCNKKKEKYDKKEKHYEKKQKAHKDNKNHYIFKRTEVPSGVEEFRDLTGFKTSKDLPKPERLVGPFICNNDIILNEDERRILNRGIEIEKSLSKHRYGRPLKTRRKGHS